MYPSDTSKMLCGISGRGKWQLVSAGRIARLAAGAAKMIKSGLGSRAVPT